MNRRDAVKIAQEAKEKWGGGSSEYWLVIALEALGVLKLDEPKTPNQRARDQARNEKLCSSTMEVCLGAIERAGLKLVDAAAPHLPQDTTNE